MIHWLISFSMIAVCAARLRYFDECWEGLRSEKCWVLRTASSSHWELFCILGPWPQRQDNAIWIWAWLPCEVWRTYSCIVCSAAALVQRMFRMDCEQGWLMQVCTVQYTAENGFTCFCLYKAQICFVVVVEVTSQTKKKKKKTKKEKKNKDCS